jgi:hypothetical protein
MPVLARQPGELVLVLVARQPPSSSSVHREPGRHCWVASGAIGGVQGRRERFWVEAGLDGGMMAAAAAAAALSCRRLVLARRHFWRQRAWRQRCSRGVCCRRRGGSMIATGSVQSSREQLPVSSEVSDVRVHSFSVSTTPDYPVQSHRKSATIFGFGCNSALRLQLPSYRKCSCRAHLYSDRIQVLGWSMDAKKLSLLRSCPLIDKVIGSSFPCRHKPKSKRQVPAVDTYLSRHNLSGLHLLPRQPSQPRGNIYVPSSVFPPTPRPRSRSKPMVPVRL